MRVLAILSAAVLTTGLLASPLTAGVLVETAGESAGRPGQTTTHRVYLEPDKMRSETKGPEGEEVVIFRPDLGTLWVIDPQEGTYLEMTRQGMRDMIESTREQMQEAMKMFEEQMKDLPPEERKMMEQMGLGRPMPTEPEEPERLVYNKVASGVRVGRWVCDQYEGYLEGEKQEDVWAADLAQLGLAKEDFRVTEEMRKFTSGLPGVPSSGGPAGFEAEQGYPGFAVREITYIDGRKAETRELKEVRRQDFPASLFELPKGLKRAEEPSFQ